MKLPEPREESRRPKEAKLWAIRSIEDLTRHSSEMKEQHLNPVVALVTNEERVLIIHRDAHGIVKEAVLLAPHPEGP